jgi:hypothetical protein
MKRYRLTARAQMHGEVREPGYVFTLEDGVKGPHRTVRADDASKQIAEHFSVGPDLVDVPLYEPVADAE